MKKKDFHLYQEQAVSYDDKQSVQFIYQDFFQSLPYSEKYPAFIQIHREYPLQSVPLHWHLGPEIIYSRNQKLVTVTNGKKSITSPGECVLFDSGVLHSVDPQIDWDGQDVMSISFDGVYLKKIYPDMGKKRICYAFGSPESREKLAGLCEKIHRLLETDPVNYLLLNFFLFSLLLLIYEEFASETTEDSLTQRKNHEKIRDALLYIKEHYQEPISVQSVAEHFGYSREHFSRLFKRYADRSFKQYLNEYRLFQAAEELYTTDKKMIEIAYDNGFPDEKSFYKSFKEKYQLTPSEYRKRKYPDS